VTVNKERVLWMLEELDTLRGLASSLRETVRHALEDEMEGPAGSLIDSLREMADGPESAGLADADRQMMRTLAADLDACVGKAGDVADRVEELIGDQVGDDLLDQTHAFVAWARANGVDRVEHLIRDDDQPEDDDQPDGDAA
jgi:hypothetical protein